MEVVGIGKLLVILIVIVSVLSFILVKKHRTKDSKLPVPKYYYPDEILVDKTCTHGQCATLFSQSDCGTALCVVDIGFESGNSTVTIYLTDPIIHTGPDDNYIQARFDSGEVKKYHYNALDQDEILGSSSVHLVGNDEIQDFIDNYKSVENVSLELPIIAGVGRTAFEIHRSS